MFGFIHVVFIYFRSIRRIIFYSLMKPCKNDNGEMEMVLIPVSQALQIAGRAGRFNTQYSEVKYLFHFSINFLSI